MLVSSIKDHEYLQKVEVTDFWNQGMYILEDMLVQLSYCTSINLEQVFWFHGLEPGSCGGVDIPSGNTVTGFVMKNLWFNIIEYWKEGIDR